MPSRKSSLPYAQFYTRGYRTVKNPYFSLKAKYNSLPENRIGVIISVAAVKSAVRRNFWRRQAKELLSHGVKQKSLDLLIIFFPRIASLTKKQFKEELIKTANDLPLSHTF